ncbi:MAG: ScyD/ScyE family protein [Acidobacteriota bacterium]|nr:ScyD/ScyE family protein [Acidobacteriota bacterium]
MRRHIRALVAAVTFIMLWGVSAKAQCPTTVLASDLRAPTKIILSPNGNLLVAEQGNGPNTGRISIIDPNSGERRTLLDGLPSAINNLGGFPAPSGPSGLAMRGRTLFIAIGVGDAALLGPFPGTELPNPNPSSPILSSILEVHFSANAEKTASGFTLTEADQFALKGGSELVLDNGKGDKLTIKLLADFPDVVPAPRTDLPDNTVSSNPFGVAVNNNLLYVADASLNRIWTVDLNTGATAVLTTFAPLTNPLPVGPPAVDAVPDSIHLFGGQLLVTLLSGFPFPPDVAQVRTVDPNTGESEPFITGLTSAIDVLPVKTPGGGNEFLTLEFSTNQLAQAPGRLQLFASPGGTPEVIADCLITPTSMALDPKTRILFVTEIFTGRIIEVSASGL